MPSLLKICTTLKQVKQLIKNCYATGYCSFDFETDGRPFHHPDSYITIMSVSFQPGSSWVVPLGHYDSPFKDNWLPVLKMFQPIFNDYKIVKIAWNFKFEYKWLMKYGITIKGRLFDGMLAKYCLEEERPMGLKPFVERVFPEFAHYELSVKGRQWDQIPLDELSLYGGIDADLTLRAMLYMEPKLISLGFYNLFRNLLMMAVRVLAESEFYGVCIDKSYLQSKTDEYVVKIRKVEEDLRMNKRALKFNKAKKLEVDKAMIDFLRLEIQSIEDGSSKQKTRMINDRYRKIGEIKAGTFTGKAGKLKTYEGLNFASPDQMREFLFTHPSGCHYKIIRYTVDKKTKAESDRASTDESVILELQEKHPNNSFLNLLLKHRELSKLHSTYLQGVLNILSHDDKVHASFRIEGTVTGRLSCTDPNLQNIPRDTTASDIKPMFIPPPGMLLLEVDYGQAELRMGAEMSEDEVMIDIFKRNYNIHIATACNANHCLDKYDIIKGILKRADEMSGAELERPGNEELLKWAKEKKKAKTVNFGIFFGQGDPKLAQGMGTSVEEATDFKKNWFKSYPRIGPWIKGQEAFARKNGYVMNMFGRKRRLPDAMFKDKWEARDHGMMGKYLEAMRQSVNAPIQGTAGDFCTFSTVVIREKKRLGELPHDMQQVYTVHDSIGFYVWPKDIHWVLPIIIEICDNPQTKKYFGFKLKHVKMKVGGEVGKSWGELRGYDAWTNYQSWVN